MKKIKRILNFFWNGIYVIIEEKHKEGILFIPCYHLSTKEKPLTVGDVIWTIILSMIGAVYLIPVTVFIIALLFQPERAELYSPLCLGGVAYLLNFTFIASLFLINRINGAIKLAERATKGLR